MPNKEIKKSYKYHFRNICNVKITDSSIKQQPYTPRNITQKDVRRFLQLQDELGFMGAWFITFHYFHPTELMYSVKERKGNISHNCIEQITYKTNDGRSIWSNSGDRKIIQMRNDLDQVSKDCRHVINVLLKEIYDIKRPHTYQGDLPSILSFHEYGTEQYHTHLVVPHSDEKILNDQNKLSYILNKKVRKKCKSLSKWKKIDIKPVNNQYGLMNYLNKQTDPQHTAVDLMSSLVIHPETKKVTAAQY